MQPETLPALQRQNYSKVLEGEMAWEQEDAGVDPEEAFLRVALKTYGFDPDDGFQTDGGFDCGFDFVHVTQDSTSIFQAKSLVFENGLPLESRLDATYLSDIRRIKSILHDLDKLPREANKTVIEALTSMRTEINRRALVSSIIGADAAITDEDEPEYRIHIYFYGLAKGFTNQAEEEFAKIEPVQTISYGKVKLIIATSAIFIDDIMTNKWLQKNVDWKDRVGKKRDEITLHISGETISDAKSVVFFAPAYDLVQAYEDFGYQIFEPNVRCELKESKVNQAIKKTVTTREGRREFRHLNNGITLVCSGWTRKAQGGKATTLSIRRPGVVNGLQTVKSLHDAFRRLSQEEQIDFKENCLVLCRVHQEGAVKRLEQLVKATNNQNPMKPRNLRSNDPEQIAFESLFGDLGWFYERKQGAWDAFKADPRAWRGLNGKKPDHFAGKDKNFKVVDNDMVGQNWLAFIGFSTEAINEKRVIFDKDEYYGLIFLKKTMRHGFDYDFKLNIGSKVWDEADSGSPAHGAMLSAFLIRSVADYLALSRKENRDASIMRLELMNKSRDEQDRALDIDPEYQKQKMLRGMLTLFVEFVGFILFRSLEDRFHKTAGDILKNGSMLEIFNNYDYSKLVKNHRQRSFDKDDLIVILYCAFEHCIGQLYESNWLRAYNDAPVKNKFIYSTRTRQLLLDELSELDKRFARTEWVRDWADGFNDAKGLFAFVRLTLLGKGAGRPKGAKL